MKRVKKLPIGIQTFKEIRSDNYIYADKTEEAYELIENYKYAFLSRPRRFGKSLFIDTLKSIFEGKKELFEGLYIYDKWDWDTKYPVIKISWAGDFSSKIKLEQRALEIFRRNQDELGIECEDRENPSNCFSELIRKTYKKYNQRVVILVDEYDKPILDVIENLEQAKINREFIKSLYSIIKDSDEYIKFSFLTGVSKFSKASIFSGLNMLSDISLNPKFGDICGYTQNDIDTIFAPYLEGVDMNRFQDYYNGYNFLKSSIYNPFDTLQFIQNDYRYSNYWFESGTPSYLIKLIKENNYFLPKLSNLVVDEKLLNTFDIEFIDIEVLLYQSGYLTILSQKERRRGGIEYKLKIPNKEVEISLSDYILDYIYKSQNREIIQDELYDKLADADLEHLKDTLKSLFASIPYNNYTNNKIAEYEGFYASVIYAYFASLGLKITGEDVTNRGRIDLTLFIEDKIYIVEFKVDSFDALKQLKEKNYAQKYINQNREIYLIGISFDSKERNIKEFEWEIVKQKSETV